MKSTLQFNTLQALIIFCIPFFNWKVRLDWKQPLKELLNICLHYSASKTFACTLKWFCQSNILELVELQSLTYLSHQTLVLDERLRDCIKRKGTMMMKND